MRDFRKYNVWKEAVDFATVIYGITETFPKFERYGLCDQMQRAAVSISSNIAEGSSRTSEKEFAHFLEMAQGSAFEVETQMLVAQNLGYIKEGQYTELLDKITNIERLINSFISKLHSSNSQNNNH